MKVSIYIEVLENLNRRWEGNVGWRIKPTVWRLVTEKISLRLRLKYEMHICIFYHHVLPIKKYRQGGAWK